jgi:hypothetical protein
MITIELFPLDVYRKIFDYIIYHSYTELWLVNKKWYELGARIPHYHRYIKSCIHFNSRFIDLPKMRNIYLSNHIKSCMHSVCSIYLSKCDILLKIGPYLDYNSHINLSAVSRKLYFKMYITVCNNFHIPVKYGIPLTSGSRYIQLPNMQYAHVLEYDILFFVIMQAKKTNIKSR